VFHIRALNVELKWSGTGPGLLNEYLQGFVLGIHPGHSVADIQTGRHYEITCNYEVLDLATRRCRAQVLMKSLLQTDGLDEREKLIATTTVSKTTCCINLFPL
jgi:hypothetical protein